MSVDHIDAGPGKAPSLKQVIIQNVALALQAQIAARKMKIEMTATMVVDYIDAHTPTMLIDSISDALDEYLDMRGIK